MTELRSFRYCFLRTNTRLKEVIKAVIKQRQTSLKEVCRINNLDYDGLLTYMNKPYYDPDNKKYASQKEVMALAAALGIAVDTKIVVKGKEK